MNPYDPTQKTARLWQSTATRGSRLHFLDSKQRVAIDMTVVCLCLLAAAALLFRTSASIPLHATPSCFHIEYKLEEKTKGMLKLIECGDADTFAQRAEMYYRRRPELVDMIEDFYRAYRCLAERHDQLKLELLNSLSNRSSLDKQWSMDSRSSASSVMFDSESEVDDPPEDDQVESKLTELPRDKNDLDVVNLKYVDAGMLRSDLSVYSIDSELSKVSYPGPKGIHNETILKQFAHNYTKNDSYYEEKQMLEAAESPKDMTRNVREMLFQQVKSLYGDLEEGQDENTLTEIRGNTNLSNQLTEEAESKVENVSEKSSTSSTVELNTVVPGREDTHMKANTEDKKCDNSDVVKVISEEVERLKGESASFRAELERKDEEKREVIRQLSVSIDILKGENDSMRKFIKDSKVQPVNRAFEFRKLKELFSGKLFGESPSYTKVPTTRVAPLELQVFSK